MDLIFKNNLKIKNLNSSCYNCNINNFCFSKYFNKKNFFLFDNINKKQITFNKNELIFKKNEIINYVYIIKSGSIKTYIFTDKGDEKILNFCFTTDFIGFDFFLNKKYISFGETLENTIVCKIPIYDFINLINKIDKLNNYFFFLMSNEIKNNKNIILLLSKKTALEKVTTFIFYLYKIWLKRGLSKFSFKISMTRYDISNYLCLTVETISRTLSYLKKKLIISISCKNITINSLQLLYLIIGKTPFIN